MTIAAAILLVLAVLFFIFRIRAQDVPEPAPVLPWQHLSDRKAAIYDSLRDLQFEYRLGKLSDADYRDTKLALQRELASVLAETELLKAQAGGAAPASPSPEPAHSAAPRTSNPPARSAPAQTPVVAAPAQACVCPNCGARFGWALKFCGECGKAMAV